MAYIMQDGLNPLFMAKKLRNIRKQILLDGSSGSDDMSIESESTGTLREFRVLSQECLLYTCRSV